ncbi:MAG: cobalamin B12-binding domain-containing protein [Polyangiaceae bacterium]|nr:cobalamin B12-binding domain-containing protein [Polyangiaceae bacterium]MCB9605098.1 cobalamin B12-binding domain-containing protein [Polyangiaceae bacterium]
MTRVDRPRVLLLWPGGLFSGGGNFGVPQLLSLAQALKRGADADVEIMDLDSERVLNPRGIDFSELAHKGYDLVGVSCYSSYDYLKVIALGELLREHLPRAWLVVGGYHPSARPGDFTREGSPFDFVVVGDGERPLLRLVEALGSGKRPLNRVLGPDSVPHPGELMPYPWELLDRYRPIARRLASQAEIYLSRGCPFDCAFCMERAKRDVSWRSLEPLHAVEELHRLDQYLDLSDWTLFIADALFGMKQAWRREFLEALAARPIRARKIWLLIRVDLIEEEDFRLMARANIGPGFGLESGDPEQLRRIRKAGKLERYLDKMLTVAEWARTYQVPFGANIIVGHPGETEKSLRTSAAYMQKLFLEHPKGSHGFLSVDPFRLYPGSPIDEERATWEAQTGMRVHRYPWWEDGDQDFLSEWVDASGELDYRATQRLVSELFDPILQALPEHFAYTGPARDYFMRAISEQVEHTRDRAHLRKLGLWHLWSGLHYASTSEARHHRMIEDSELQARAKRERIGLVERVRRHVPLSPELERAMLEVPRERFVPAELVHRAAEDVALRLDDSGQSTISAPHAYALSFNALDIEPGDQVADLGGGSGYGAALLAELVGPQGNVTSIEYDPKLVCWAQQNLAPWPWAQALAGDAHDVALWRGANKVSIGFALDELPPAFIEALPVGGRLVAPVHPAEPRDDRSQDLLLVTRTALGFETQRLERVLYVPDRGTSREPSSASS